ncbi:hypothetical protein [Natronoglycomyces albus]|uniref:Uncharacterized protein n=1 Tax=Natronoglycomyces albus TaxID=2811108 RepID=A0A895XJK3_9ACTN|nr:hypothetical protein [Natronoglycomyces albus]QSB05941.1 hypothetical protein JQS30_03170 [Natronoglycomyces albus]
MTGRVPTWARVFGKVSFRGASGMVLAGFSIWLVSAVSGLWIEPWQVLVTSALCYLFLRVFLATNVVVQDFALMVAHDVNRPHVNPFEHVKEWERTLIFAQRYPDHFTDFAQQKLRALTAKRLSVRHHLNLADHPDESRALIGSELYDFLHDPTQTFPTRAEFDRYLSQIEKI